MPSSKKNRKPKTSTKKDPKQKNNVSYTAQQLLDAADQALHGQDPTQALNLYTAAIEKCSDQSDLLLDILEKRATVKVSLADHEGALQDYKACLELDCLDEKANSLVSQESSVVASNLERKAGIFMYMGQLSEGVDALEDYRQAMELLERALVLREEAVNSPTELKNSDKTEDNHKAALREVRQQMATAHCTMAELYLTDLCLEENAEQECESYIQQSLKITGHDGEPIVDALQTCASLRLSQSRGLEAVAYILRAFEKIRVGCEALASLVGMRESVNPDEATELLETEAAQSLPGFEFRVQTAKILLECADILKEQENEDGRRVQCLRAAIDVLGSLMAETDEVVEIWALAGDAFAALDPTSPKLAAHYWERAMEMLVDTKRSLEQQLDEVENDDEEEEINQELEEAVCQMEFLKTKLDGIRCSEVAMEVE